LYPSSIQSVIFVVLFEDSLNNLFNRFLMLIASQREGAFLKPDVGPQREHYSRERGERGD